MNKYVINKEYSGSREVAASSFSTVGDFVDFFSPNGRGDLEVTFRMRAELIYTIERVNQ
ncbi:hypothetical protein ACLGI4_14995 [Streptomyces sp. HMX112]|uniref:Uncharacterized protein n=1 Tax=Streptomyces ficellus TaxID=1977088 RepID=A0ABT7ZDG6_9ACTN|nr:hypothetical protein [Streptomyces ficellus]MDN3297488.1 hypothetical protein [Streptomyces ficellus]